MSRATAERPAARRADAPPPPPAAAAGRLESLDVLRGATVAAMLLVNNPGSWAAVYPQLRHAEWHGWTATDLIFPFFLFIVGVSLALSFEKLRARGVTRRALLAKSARRAATLVVLGLVLHAYPWWQLDPSHLRLPGVLQRIGVAFLLAAAVVLWTGWRGQAAAAAIILVGYWAAMRWVPVPGVGAGVWEPGRDLGAYLDRRIFGTDHLWAAARTWDPEGLLSTLPAVATVLIGVLAARWLRAAPDDRGRLAGLLVAGMAGIGLGLLWHPAFPINKPLWTSSYVLFTGGAALLALAACHWLVDARGHRRWAFPFRLFGVNAIAAFFLASLTARVIGTVRVPGGATVKAWLHETLFAPHLSPVNASLAFALAYVALWTAVMWVFYRRGVFIKV